MKLLDLLGVSGVLSLSQSTKDELRKKHSMGSEADPSVSLKSKPSFVEPVMFKVLHYWKSTIANTELALRRRRSIGSYGLGESSCQRFLEQLVITLKAA